MDGTTTTEPKEGTMIDLETLTLGEGKHVDRDDGVCLLEAVAWWAGEPHSDYPECVSPVIAAFGRAWNDALGQDDRDRLLRPLIPRLAGTADGEDVEDRRAWMCCDWLVRVCTPTWLRHAGLDDDAAALEALPELTSAELVDAAMPAIHQARERADAAGGAPWDAWAAARAAGGAARDAAGAAGGDVGTAAGDVAGAAAWAAARDAAGAAAGAAAGDALAETVTGLQQSALGLLDRMIALHHVPVEPVDV